MYAHASTLCIFIADLALPFTTSKCNGFGMSKSDSFSPSMHTFPSQDSPESKPIWTSTVVPPSHGLSESEPLSTFMFVPPSPKSMSTFAFVPPSQSLSESQSFATSSPSLSSSNLPLTKSLEQLKDEKNLTTEPMFRLQVDHVIVEARSAKKAWRKRLETSTHRNNMLQINTQSRSYKQTTSTIATFDDKPPPIPPSSYVSSITYTSGIYRANVMIGTPAQRLNLIVDVSSSFVWLQCIPCSSCYLQKDALFNISSSSTFQKVDCQSNECEQLDNLIHPQHLSCLIDKTCVYKLDYSQSTSTIGNFSTDTLSITKEGGRIQSLSSKFQFGCGVYNRGTFPSGAGGYLGLGRGPLSLISQLNATQFSYCFVTLSDTLDKTRHSSLVVGANAIQRFLSLDDPHYFSAPLIVNPFHKDFYYVALSGLHVNGVNLPLPIGIFDIDAEGEGGVIIDTNTPFTHLAHEVYSILVARVTSLITYPRAHSSMGFPVCYNITGIQQIQLPNIAFKSHKSLWHVPTQNSYFLIDAQIVCLAVLSSGDKARLSVIGNFQQQEFDMGFDLHNSALVVQPRFCGS